MRVITVRRTGRIAFGDDGDPDLRGRIRAQGNFSEYAPLGLLLLLLAELAGASAVFLHLSGLLLLSGRLCHAWSLSAPTPGRFGARTVGMLMTFTALILSAALALPWTAIF